MLKFLMGILESSIPVQSVALNKTATLGSEVVIKLDAFQLLDVGDPPSNETTLWLMFVRDIKNV